MKLNGIVGTGTGKMGNAVFSTVAGKQVVRQYQPVVANPSTTAQVDQRARLKLASQLAAALAPVIAIPRDGLKSSRNLFIKKNFDAITANGGTAQVSYENLQLTAGNIGLPGINITRSEEAGVGIALRESAGASLSRVVYSLYKKSSEQQLQFIASTVVTAAGDAGTFPATFSNVEGELVAYAYGMIDLNGKATAKYGDYNVQTGLDVARLVLTRNITTADYQLTKTRGNTLFSGDSESIAPDDGNVMLYVTSSPAGVNITSSVALTGGRAQVPIGTSVTLTAPVGYNNDEYQFEEWVNNSTNQRLSGSNEYTFVINENTDIQARYQFIGDGPSGGGE